MSSGIEVGRSDEERRLASLHEYAVLDTPADEAFDRVTALAARLLDMPVALVSLVDGDRIWFKSRVGLDAPEIGRDPGLCGSAILQDEVWVIEDTSRDERSAKNPLVTTYPGVRFYAGAPLRVRDGHVLGTLCVLDRVPRSLTGGERDLLRDLADIVVDALELRYQTRQTFELLRQADAAARRARDAAIEALASHRELQERDDRKTTLLRAVAHDLSAPLAALVGMTDLLALRSGDLSEPQRAELTERLAENARELQRMTAALLDRDRLHGDGHALERTVVDLRELTTLVTSRPHLAEAPIAVTHGPKAAVVDGLILERILDNLLTNACRHACGATRIEVDLSAGERQGVTLTVSDDGPGIAEADRERVLEAFSRLDDRRPRPGVGLGLSLVSRFAAMHDGSVVVDEAPGGGARFTVELPGGGPASSRSTR